MSRPSLTPRSRSATPSRAPTPIPHVSPSGLIPPVLHSAPSLSSLRVYSHTPSAAPTPVSTSPPSLIGDSSSSSATNVEPAEGILVPEAEAEVEVTDEQVVVSPRTENPATDEEAKRNLRDHLRRTLSQRADAGEVLHSSARRKGKRVDTGASQGLASTHIPRQYFVLTDAGKPVFVSRQEDENSDNFTSIIGLMQALISVFIDDGDKLRCINAGSTRITVLLRPPLYYACVSSWGEPESVKDTLPFGIPPPPNP